MSQNEFRGKYEFEKKDPLKPWYPVIGLLLLAIGLAVGVLASGTVLSFLQGSVAQLQAPICKINEIYKCQMQMIIAGAIGLVTVGVFSAVFAVFAPKPPGGKKVAESTLKTEKEEIERERIRAKRRQAQMRQKMKKSTKEKSG